MPAFGLLGIDFGYGLDGVNDNDLNPNGWETHFVIGQKLLAFMTLVRLFNFILFLTFFIIYSMDKRNLEAGYINMEYILSNIEHFEVANKEFEYKIDQWKKEISKKENEIKVKREELNFEKDLIPNQIYLKRNKELDYDIEELESYRNKRFGPEGDWLVQEKILIQPIQDEVLAIVQQIAEKNKFDFIFDKSSAVIMLYSEKIQDERAGFKEYLETREN